MKQSKLQSLAVAAFENVDDPVFSSGAMGQGIAVEIQAKAWFTHQLMQKYRLPCYRTCLWFEDSKWSWNLDPRWYRHGDERRRLWTKGCSQGDKVKAGDVLEPLTQTKSLGAAGLEDSNGYRNTADYASVSISCKRIQLVKGDAIIAKGRKSLILSSGQIN